MLSVLSENSNLCDFNAQMSFVTTTVDCEFLSCSGCTVFISLLLRRWTQFSTFRTRREHGNECGEHYLDHQTNMDHEMTLSVDF